MEEALRDAAQEGMLHSSEAVSLQVRTEHLGPHPALSHGSRDHRHE